VAERTIKTKTDLPPYVIDEKEIASRCLLTPAEWRATAIVLERNGFPSIHPVLGRRLRGQVDAWFETGASSSMTLKPDGEENWSALATRRRKPKP